MAEAGTLIEAEDILYVLGEFENVKRFAGENRLSLLDTHKTEGVCMIRTRDSIFRR